MAKNTPSESEKKAIEIRIDFYKELRSRAGILTKDSKGRAYREESGLLIAWIRFSDNEYRGPEEREEKNLHDVYEKVKAAFKAVTSLDSYKGSPNDYKGPEKGEPFIWSSGKTYERMKSPRAEEKLVGYTLVCLCRAIYTLPHR